MRKAQRRQSSPTKRYGGSGISMIDNAGALELGLREHGHGDQCSCRLLAAAIGAGPSAVTFSYCQLVLKKRWKVRCNHGGDVPATRATLELPPRDPHDMVQAILVANAESSID